MGKRKEGPASSEEDAEGASFYTCIRSTCNKVRISNAVHPWLLVVRSLASLGGYSCGDSVRHMLNKLGSYKLWSLYSLKGKRNKIAFNAHPLCSMIIKAGMKIHGVPESKVEYEIVETLKHAPNKEGVSR